MISVEELSFAHSMISFKFESSNIFPLKIDYQRTEVMKNLRKLAGPRIL